MKTTVLEIKTTATGRFAILAVPVSERVVVGTELDLELRTAPIAPVTAAGRPSATATATTTIERAIRSPSDVDVLG